MSGAKDKMRNKKMKNQPASVTGWVRGHQKAGQPYDQVLPKAIAATGYMKARAAEVNAMLKAVTQTKGNTDVFGALPKHMRRRAMSHNTKRLPCRLRDLANKMLEKSRKEKKEQSKAKSRKARRRHGNLLLEFNRRQRRNVWLETHIWHAKRFHMVRRWGYCLPVQPTYKSYRPSYRAMSSHCLLQDLSYYCCVELQGPEDQLLAALATLTNKDSGPTFAAAVCLSGRRQGSTMVYRAGQSPARPLGPVLFLWRPRTLGSTYRQLWVWTHPTLKQDLLPELQAACHCSEAVPPPPTPVEMPAPAPAPAPAPQPAPETRKGLVPGRIKASKRKAEAKAARPPVKKILGDGTRSPTTPVTWKSSSTGIVISDLTMEIVRYRLIGPLSHSVLTETLEPATDCDAISKSQKSCFWWPEYCKDEGKMTLHRQQAHIFHLLKGIFSTAEVPSGSVLGLTVDDPRLTLPSQRGKAMPDLQQAQEVDEDGRRRLILQGVPERCSQSSLWDRSVRDNVTDHKIPEQELNRQRSELLVPGSRLRPPPQGRIPVLLVQQPGKQVGLEQPSWGAGWDLLLPKAWGMAFWVPLIYRGVRVGGLKMGLKHSQNKGAPHFPHDYPDCPAGERFQHEQEEELLTKFKRRPPAKRTNYIKHGCLTPFRCPWQQLAEEWELIVREGGEADGGEKGEGRGGESAAKTRIPPVIPKMGEVTSQGDVAFTVLRNWKSLRQLSGWCRPTSSKGQRSQRQWVVPPLTPAAAGSALASRWRSLVWVRLSLLCKGQPELHAQVCVPTAEDLLLQRREPGCGGPLEALHKDHFKSRLPKRRKKPAASSSSHKAKSQQSDATSSSTPTPCPATASTPAPCPATTSTPAPCPATTSNPAPCPATASTPAPCPATASTPAPCPATTSTPAPCPATATTPAPGPSPGGSAPTSTPVPSLTPGPDPSASSSSPPALTQGLWPEPLPSVSSHCSRMTLGWVTQGDFSLSAGCGEALGFVSLPGLLHMLLSQPAEQRGLVLLRNPSSLQYRFAKLNIEA